MRKEDYEKAAWGWTDETDPEYVSQHHVDLAYRIKLDSCRPNSCRKNCRGNPLCVKGLGESRWIGPKAAAAAEEAWSSSLEDPNALRRAEDSFVGLKNLGATCYINSLLQLWFHNLEFRWAIYLWSPEEDPQEKMNETIMAGEYKPESSTAHLQVLFALMQFGKRSYEDPSDFIRSLDVDTTQQQDAQEFSKLFFSLLEKGLSHQSSHAVKNIISQQFCGTLSYITKCAHCFTDSDTPALFYELELNIAGHTTLSECMEEYFKEEELQGDNRYLCSVCKAKQDATRQTVLKSLPPVLNLQLIRFVYDRQKGVKKKLHSYLQFPESLDMSPYVKKPLGSLMYSISAVLIHTGPSAYSGHYVAHICESTTGTWYKFNDEAVEKMEGKKLKLGTEDSFEDGNKKNKPPKATKGNLVSNNAYMLVYTESKKKEQQSAENNVIQATDKEYFSLSQRLKDFVAREGQKFEDWVSEVKKSKAVLVEKSKAKQQEMEKICNMLPVIGNAPYEFISADWLAKWLTTDDVKSIDNSSFICKDGKLDPSKVDKTKCISTCAADVLYSKYGGGPRLLGENSKCFDCVKHSCKVIRMKAKIAEDSKKVASLLKFKPASGETLFWVGKDSLKNWRKLVLQEIEDVHKKDTVKESNGCNGEAGSSVDEVTTSRNNQDDRLVGSSESNVVSSTSNTTSQNNQDDRLVDSSESNDVSSTSENHIHASENGLEQKLKYVQIKTPGFGGDVIHRESVDSEMCEVSEGDTVPANNAAGISSSDDPVYHEEQAVHNGKVPECPVKEEGTKEEEQDDEEALDFNEDLRCTHGDLCVEQSFRRLVSEQVWEIFKSYFPSAPTFVESTEACRHCEDRTHEDAVTSGIYRQAAASQKAKLLDLYLVRNRVSFSVSPSLQRQKQPMNQVFHLVSRKFINSWRKFIRCPGQRVPPDTIENSDLLCPHGGLLYNPEIEEDSNSSCSFEIASDAEWEALCSFYPSDRDIVVKRDPCNNTLIYNPDICPECVMERIRLEQMERLQYDKAKIFVRKVNKRDTSNERINECANGAATTSQTENKDDPEYQGGEVKRPKLAPGVSNSPTHRGGSPAGEGRVRKSTRHRRVRGEVEFSVSSNTTLMDFKVKVMHEFEVAPFDQHLSLNGRELLDTNATLGSLQVFPGSIIVLKVVFLHHQQSAREVSQGKQNYEIKHRIFLPENNESRTEIEVLVTADEPSEDPSMMEDYISGLTFEEGFKGTALLK